MSVLIQEVVHTFDTPFVQNLTLIGAEEVKELDRRYGIFTGCGDTHASAGRQTLIHKGCALRICIHGERDTGIGGTQLAVRLQYLLSIQIIPV